METDRSGLNPFQGLGESAEGNRNRQAQWRENERNRKWSDDRANIDYQRSIDDWNRQNAYNHPLQQMNRLKEAGLNPNLVYGKGADNTAGMIRGISRQTPNTATPRYDSSAARAWADLFGNKILQFMDIKQRQASTDLLHEQAAIARKEQLLKDAQIISEITKGKQGEFDLEFNKEVRERRLNIVKSQDIEAEMSAWLKYGEADQFVKTWDKRMDIIWEQATQAKLTTQQMRNLIELQKIEVDLARQGIQKNDPLWLRIMYQNAKKYDLLKYFE